MRTSWETLEGRQCLTSLEIEPGLTFQQITEALAHLADQAERRASPTQLAKALAVLTAVCAKPADFDDAKVVLWSERLKQVLAEYPGDIALAAVSGWPRTENGKWWPTENEIRSECDIHMRFRERLRFEMERAQCTVRPLDPATKYDDGMHDTPSGATEAFVQKVYNRNSGTYEAYFGPCSGARFTADTIGVRGSMVALTIERQFPGLMAECGVRIISPRAFTDKGEPVWPL